MTDTEILNWLDTRYHELLTADKTMTGEISLNYQQDDGEYVFTSGKCLRECVEQANDR